MKSRQWPFVFFLSTLFAGTACPLSPVYAATVMPDGPLNQDARLQRPLTLNAIGVSLEDVLAQVSNTGPRLTCYKSIGIQKLQVHLQQRPEYVLMRALATLTGGKWKIREDNQGYILEPSPIMLRDRDRWWQAFLDERKAALAAHADFLKSELRKTPQERPVTEENAPPGSPTANASRSLFNSLPEALLSRIADNMDDSSFYSANTSHRVTDNEGTTMIAVNQLPDSIQKGFAQQGFPLAASSSALMQIINIGSLVSAQVMNQDGTPLSASHTLDIPGSPALELLKLEQDELPEMVRKMGSAASANLKLLAAFQQKTVWKNDPPKREPDHQWPRPRRAEVLQRLAEKANIDFVADYYSRPGIPLSAIPRAETLEEPLQNPTQDPLQRPLLEEALNIRAVEQDMSWKHQDGLYLFRNNRWYRDDLLEVPPLLAKRSLARRVPQPEKQANYSIQIIRRTIKDQLDSDAEFATNLTRWQIANGLKWLASEDKMDKPAQALQAGSSPFSIFPFYWEAEQVMQEYNVARFYGSLGADAQNALLEKRMPLSELTNAQRNQALYLNPILQSFGVPPLKDVLLGLAPAGIMKQKIGLVFSAPVSQ